MNEYTVLLKWISLQLDSFVTTSTDNFFSEKKKKKNLMMQRNGHRINFIFNLNSSKNSDFTKRNH